MWFQHDGCPEDYSMVARGILNHDFNGHWIGRAGPILFVGLTNQTCLCRNSSRHISQCTFNIHWIQRPSFWALTLIERWRDEGTKLSTIISQRREGLTLIKHPEANRILICSHRCSWVALKVVYSPAINISIGNNFQVVRNLQHERRFSSTYKKRGIFLLPTYCRIICIFSQEKPKNFEFLRFSTICHKLKKMFQTNHAYLDFESAVIDSSSYLRFQG